MDRGALSNNNRDFIRQAIREEVRIDGRGLYEHRKLSYQFSLDDSSATVHLGGTRVMAAVAATLEAPYNDRSREGSLRFNVELSPMASPSFEAGRPGEGAVELSRIVERAIKQSGAVDMEALCVLPGRKVWSLRVDVHVLDHCGNLVDGCCLAALAALVAFKKPQVSVGQADDGSPDQIIVHSPDVREPQPLTIHHTPFPVSFALFEAGNAVAIDPSLQEEAACEGGMTLVVNPHGEVCAVQKADGVGLDRDQLMRCVRIATGTAENLAGRLKEALRAHDAARVAARVRRRVGGPGDGGPGAAEGGGGSGGEAGLWTSGDGRHVVVLRDVGQADARLDAMMREMEAAAAAVRRDAEASSSDDDGSGGGGEESTSGSDEEGQPQRRQKHAKASSGGVAAAQGEQRQQQQVAAAGFVKPSKATLKSEDFARKATIGSAATGGKRPLQQPSPTGNRPKGQRGGNPAAAAPDNMAAIAAIIAGAGAAGGPPPDLAAAVKPKAKKKKQQAGARGAGGGD